MVDMGFPSRQSKSPGLCGRTETAVLLASVVCRPKVQQSDCAKGCKLISGYKHDDDNRHGCARMGELRGPPEGLAEFAVYHSAYARLYYRVARWLEGR